MNTPEPFKVALVSMPWSIFNRPSIQLGALQSYLNAKNDCETRSFHPYLNVAKNLGTELYHTLSMNGWAGEAVFSALLYPERKNKARDLFEKEVGPSGSTNSSSGKVAFDEICNTVEQCCQKWLKSSTVHTYDLIGFTVCFNQLLPSLYMSKLIKQANKDSLIVFGGSSCSAELGKTKAYSFADLDFVISGEGEETLYQLCRYLQKKRATLPPRIFTSGDHTHDVPSVKASLENGENNHSDKELNLNELPLPDYGDYFKEVSELFPGQPFIPVIPIEFSRGCWWNKCSFCNLNIQWKAYRFKTHQKMLKEIAALCKQFESLHFTFTDNALPPKEADLFFQHIEKQQHLDLDFFAEIRAINDVNSLKLYRSGGLSTVQIGIESLSTSLLTKLKKGTTAIDNIAAMKMCSENGIQMEGNLILEFPTSTENEVQETIDNLEFVFPFHPLDTATFFLGYGSSVFRSCNEYLIDSILLHRKNKSLFPRELQKNLTFFQYSYRGDRKLQTKLWRPVRKKVGQWKKFHQKRVPAKHPLTFRDGITFLIIRQEQLDGPTLHHRLRGLSRKIYLACGSVIEIEKLQQMFPQVSKEKLIVFIDDLCNKRIMFREKNRVLALAVRQDS